MKKLRKNARESRQTYTARVTAIYWHPEVKGLDLAEICCEQIKLDPSELTIKIPPTVQAQVNSLQLKVNDRIQFVARHSFDLWGTARKTEYKTKLHAPNKFKLIPKT